MYISIFLASIRANNLEKFFTNLEETADDLNNFEVLVKIDDGENKLINLLDKYKKNSNLNIKYLATPKEKGYYSLHKGYNDLLNIADKSTYFCWLLTDEIRFVTQGWDSILKKYIKLYDDDIFRLKMSLFKYKNYYDFFEAFPCPDNYALTTKKWLEITGGWGDFWGPDSWHQAIDFFLGQCTNEFYPYGIWRSIPITDVELSGQEAGQGIVDEKELHNRAVNIRNGWLHHSSYNAQSNFKKLALRLNAHILAKATNLDKYLLEENINKKQIYIINKDNNYKYPIWSYRLPKFKINLIIGNSAWLLSLKLKYFILNNISSYKILYKILHKIYIMHLELIGRIKVFVNNIKMVIFRMLKVLKVLKVLKLFKINFNKQNNNKYKIIYYYDGKNYSLINSDISDLDIHINKNIIANMEKYIR